MKVIKELAKQYRCAILMSYSELEEGEEHQRSYYNSSMLINKEGEVLLNYRKTHLWSTYEEKKFSYGETLSPVIELEGM